MSVRSYGFTRRHGGAATPGVLNHEGHEAHEERPSEGPPQAAWCDVRLRASVPPCETVTSVTSVASQVVDVFQRAAFNPFRLKAEATVSAEVTRTYR